MIKVKILNQEKITDFEKEIEDYLNNGWSIKGYSISWQMGMSRSVILTKES